MEKIKLVAFLISFSITVFSNEGKSDLNNLSGQSQVREQEVFVYEKEKKFKLKFIPHQFHDIYIFLRRNGQLIDKQYYSYDASSNSIVFHKDYVLLNKRNKLAREEVVKQGDVLVFSYISKGGLKLLKSKFGNGSVNALLFLNSINGTEDFSCRRKKGRLEVRSYVNGKATFSKYFYGSDKSVVSSHLCRDSYLSGMRKIYGKGISDETLLFIRTLDLSNEYKCEAVDGVMKLHMFKGGRKVSTKYFFGKDKNAIYKSACGQIVKRKNKSSFSVDVE